MMDGGRVLGSVFHKFDGMGGGCALAADVCWEFDGMGGGAPGDAPLYHAQGRGCASLPCAGERVRLSTMRRGGGAPLYHAQGRGCASLPCAGEGRKARLRRIHLRPHISEEQSTVSKLSAECNIRGLTGAGAPLYHAQGEGTPLYHAQVSNCPMEPSGQYGWRVPQM
eukprot:gene10220-biopygen9317